MRPHVIRAGETLGLVAKRAGRTPDEVWSHPANADLRRRRAHSEVLAPGDVVRVHDAPAPGLRFTKGARNAYRTEVAVVEVRLVLRREGEPMAHARCVLLGAEEELHADGDGAVTLRVPEGVERVTLLLPDEGLVLPVAVGHLDPSDTRTGQQQRLRHLGYLERGAPDDAVSGAVAAFQRAKGIEATGQLDDATRAALEEEHGG